MLKKVLTVVIALLLVLATASGVRAYSFDTKVSSKAGVLAKLVERISLIAKFNNESRAKYWQKLTDIRLAELKMVADENNHDLVDETSSRYSTYLGKYAGFVINKGVKSQKDTILKQFDSHSGILTELRDKYKYDSAWWLMIQHDINTIGIFKSRIEKEL